jgi:hypothetical protein
LRRLVSFVGQAGLPSTWLGPGKTRHYVALMMTLALPVVCGAQSVDDLAKQTQNPVAGLISVPLQGNWDFGLGDRDATATLLNIQPVMPFEISSSTNVILRVIMPLTSQPAPPPVAGADGLRVNGLGDVVTTAFFSPARSGRIIWGVGPVFLLPVATNNALGSEKFGIGPSIVVLTQPGKWTLGALYNQIWSVAARTIAMTSARSFCSRSPTTTLGLGSRSVPAWRHRRTTKPTRHGRRRCCSASARLRCSGSGR